MLDIICTRKEKKQGYFYFASSTKWCSTYLNPRKVATIGYCQKMQYFGNNNSNVDRKCAGSGQPIPILIDKRIKSNVSNSVRV